MRAWNQGVGRTVMVAAVTVGLACSGGAATGATPGGVGGSADNPFVAQHREQGGTPEGALAVWLRAAIAAGQDDAATRAAGEEALGRLTVEFRTGPDWTTRPSARTFRERLRSHPHIFRSYFTGATPENGYRAEDGAALNVAGTRQEGDGVVRVNLVSSGADSPRGVTLEPHKQDGRYYVHRFSNVYVDIRKPVDPDAEF